MVWAPASQKAEILDFVESFKRFGELKDRSEFAHALAGVVRSVKLPWDRFTYTMEQEEPDLHISIDVEAPDPLRGHVLYVQTSPLGGCIVMSVHYVWDDLRGFASGVTDSAYKDFIATGEAPETLEKILHNVSLIIRQMFIYFFWVQNSDYHLVESRSVKKCTDPRAKKKPWLKTDLPHILALNRMPHEKGPGNGGTHASPKGHRRRGFWKTLRHPRFRNHPQYGSRIWVRPTWVGPLRKVVAGNIYRVLDPEPDINVTDDKTGT
jgi:hypothetical protein